MQSWRGAKDTAAFITGDILDIKGHFNILKRNVRTV